MEPHVLQSVFK